MLQQENVELPHGKRKKADAAAFQRQQYSTKLLPGPSPQDQVANWGNKQNRKCVVQSTKKKSRKNFKEYQGCVICVESGKERWYGGLALISSNQRCQLLALL